MEILEQSQNIGSNQNGVRSLILTSFNLCQVMRKTENRPYTWYTERVPLGALLLKTFYCLLYLYEYHNKLSHSKDPLPIR
jgi:hypothetical protein